MRLYRTKNGNIINMDNVSLIYIDQEWSRKEYQVVTKSGDHIYLPELTEDDLETIMQRWG